MQYIIRATRSVHCSRGPVLCAKCRALDEDKWMLLDIDPPNQDRVARPSIQITLDGKTDWRVFDSIRIFKDEAEARLYASAHHIPIVE